MGSLNFIPAGRTAMLKRRGVSLQVQTEYAYRPTPRITTTILNNGRVLHRISRDLGKPIESIEEQNMVEDILQKQHQEVLGIIKDESSALPLPQDDAPTMPPTEMNREIPAAEATPVAAPPPVTEGQAYPSEKTAPTLIEQLKDLPGVEHVYRLGNDGSFHGANVSEAFKRRFADVIENIKEVLDVFMLIPGVGITRERGVCEIVPGELYLASAGPECYFVVTRPIAGAGYEQMIKDILDPSPFRKRNAPPS